VPRGELEVIEFLPRQGGLDAVPAGNTHKSENLSNCFDSRTLASVAAAFVALALHVLLVAPVLWVGALSQQREQRYRGDATDLQWVALAESPGHSVIMSPRLASSANLMSIAVINPLPTLPSSLLPPEPSSSSAQPDEQSGLGTPYGGYLGQIRARIERAWLRPRTPIGAPIFQCQVQVDQDRVGRVQQVTLLECNGGAPWRLSLVQAIQVASPLPVPSDPAVFAPHVLLAFRAMAYAPGEPAELYEPVRGVPNESSEGGNRSQNAFQALREAAQAPKPGVLKLQIEGSKVDVEPDRK
jgi:hypothetical protein